MNDMELQPLPKREDSSPKSENNDSLRPTRVDKPACGSDERRSEPNNGSLRNKKTVDKYGFLPPMCLKSDVEVSRWILEAEQEDRRRAAEDAERNDRRQTASKRSRGYGAEDDLQSKRAAVERPISRYHASRRLRHRGCSYWLPVSEPITIPKVRYDPLDPVWRYQEQRRKQAKATENKKVPKKDKQSMLAMAEDGFIVANDQSDDYDYDSDDDMQYNEKGEVQCPICSQPPGPADQELEIAVDVTPRGQYTAVTIVTTADTTTVVAYPPADAVHDEPAFVTAVKVAIHKTSIDLIHQVCILYLYYNIVFSTRVNL